MVVICRYSEEINKNLFKDFNLEKDIKINENIIKLYNTKYYSLNLNEDNIIVFDLYVELEINTYEINGGKYFQFNQKKEKINDYSKVYIFLDKKLVIFDSKNKAKRFGFKIIKEILFPSLEYLEFNINSIENDVKKNSKIFENIWYILKDDQNTSGGETVMIYGNYMEDDSKNKKGIGIHFKLGNKKFKIQISEFGVINPKIKEKNIKDKINLIKVLLNTFLKYSNINEEFKTKIYTKNVNNKLLTDFI